MPTRPGMLSVTLAVTLPYFWELRACRAPGSASRYPAGLNDGWGSIASPQELAADQPFSSKAEQLLSSETVAGSGKMLGALGKALSEIVTRRPGQPWLRLNLAGSFCHTLSPAPSCPPRSPPQAMACASSAVVEGDAAAFAAAIRSLINNPQFSDVTFVVGRERQEVFAHRCILACRCQAFQGMLSQPQTGAQEPCPPQTPLVLSHVQPEVFLAVLEFLYTNSVTLNSLTALEVLTSAVEYGLDDLRKLCIDFLTGALSVELVCEALQAAVTYGQTDLQEHCLVFVEDRTQEVVQTRSFHELSAAALVAVLRSDRLAIDEPDLIQAVREWAHVSSAVLERPVAEVAVGPVRELRLPLLSPHELAALESHNQRDPLIPVECIAEAWKCHVLKKGSGAPSRLCQRRRGTQPREHHSYLE
ncbi:BTB/POZ domain-containing protein 19 [Gopherus evgoodei]|uniref:BTB/POZ domain-containing protein 19 n=1 Tax=Gopherus evgoodei TaxID=1825980 RepID=UPI0011CFD51F|nr:BTB/POZ domain-containing protein 19 [Gopherus evgoodei]